MLATRITDLTPAGSPGLPELKAELTKLAEEVARITAERARKSAEMAQKGVDATRDTMSDYPLTSVAGAFALGALLGLALTSPARSSRSWSNYDLRNEFAGYADNIRRSVSGSSMADGLERLTSALSATDAKASIGPAFERLVSWLNQAKATAKDAVNKATS